MVYCFKILLNLYVFCNSNENNKDCDFIESNLNVDLCTNYAKKENLES